VATPSLVHSLNSESVARPVRAKSLLTIQMPVRCQLYTRRLCKVRSGKVFAGFHRCAKRSWDVSAGAARTVGGWMVVCFPYPTRNRPPINFPVCHFIPKVAKKPICPVCAAEFWHWCGVFNCLPRHSPCEVGLVVFRFPPFFCSCSHWRCRPRTLSAFLNFSPSLSEHIRTKRNSLNITTCRT